MFARPFYLKPKYKIIFYGITVLQKSQAKKLFRGVFYTKTYRPKRPARMPPSLHFFPSFFPLPVDFCFIGCMLYQNFSARTTPHPASPGKDFAP
jgi:hypothetical protein